MSDMLIRTVAQLEVAPNGTVVYYYYQTLTKGSRSYYKKINNRYVPCRPEGNALPIDSPGYHSLQAREMTFPLWRVEDRVTTYIISVTGPDGQTAKPYQARSNKDALEQAAKDA